MPDLYHWAQLFCAATWEEIIMLSEKNKEICECIVTLKELSEDEKIQMECEAREKARRDAVAREDYITEKALKEGFCKGHAAGLAVGHAEGHAEGLVKMSKLVSILLKDNRLSDLEKASSDSEFRERLFTEYNL